jgi:murein DD-endopeptidase MepM/ murein hydrolase activator NlpD
MPQFVKWEGNAAAMGRAMSRSIQTADLADVYRFGVSGLGPSMRAGPNDPSYGSPRPLAGPASARVAWFEWQPAKAGNVMVEVRDARNLVLDTFQLAIKQGRLGAFKLEMSSPIQAVKPTKADGPGGGGHTGPDWFIAAGMDFHAPAGTEVLAAFDGYVSRLQPHNKAGDSAKVFGAQIFVRAHNNGVGAFYTHITDVPNGIRQGTSVKRGDRLGVVYTNHQTGPHLHWALVEILGATPGTRYPGPIPGARYAKVNLHEHFVSLSGSATSSFVRFAQNGTPPHPTA